ncbi:MAG: GNAT family N-acetyltransferase [Actinobacteria bacterium]|nr:GNAT family N-acetyltransferase [Actinomycetota bacterium]
MELDNPVWSALNGPHSRLAEVNGRARRYPVEVSLFAGIDDLDDEQSWHDLSQMVGPDDTPVFIRREFRVAPGWEVILSGVGVQMLGDKVEGFRDPDVVDLNDDDVPQMLDLVARTEPGPFALRTIELGGYIGFKEEGKLIAMAGRRMNPLGWCEISAVCTDPDFRGRGMAGRLARTLVANINADGNKPFLHAAASNENAIRLYEAMGFELRTEMNFGVFKLL